MDRSRNGVLKNNGSKTRRGWLNKPTRAAYFFRTLLRLPMEYKILIANSLFIVLWVLGGHYFPFLVWGLPSVVILVSMILFNFILIRLAILPMIELSRFMDMVSQGNFQHRAKYHPLGDKITDKCSDSANSMLDALQNALSYLQVQWDRSRLQAQRVIEAQEEERKRIARELHDETSQALAALMIGLEQLQRNMPNLTKQCSGCKHEVTDLKKLTDRTMAELHRLAFNLRPSLLDDMGLKHALSWFIREQVEKSGLKVQFVSEGVNGDELPDEVEITLFRIAQESLTNIVKYAKAERVNVELHAFPEEVTLKIADDGVGFNPSKIAKNKDHQLGIFGMQERTAILSGKFQLKSSPGHGTTIDVAIPISKVKEKL